MRSNGAALAVEISSDRAACTRTRRARFLQTVAEAGGTTLPDNIDYLFHPGGVDLPDPATIGLRLVEQLEVLDACHAVWDGMGDEESRELLLRLFAYRALGPAHVRLQLDPVAYRRTVIGISAQAMRRGYISQLPSRPFEWQLHDYDLHPLGLPIRVVGSPLPVASTMAFSQYAYRKGAVHARPYPGDIAIDAGGCWGDTALWLAHAVGPAGRVHTFEPSPPNREIMRHNLELNPELAERITVWNDPLGAETGEPVWIPDMLGAALSLSSDPTVPSDDVEMLELRTRSIDDLVAERQIPRVDFLKIDVEGGDLGVLIGASEMIRTQQPRIAVACYHKPDDLVTIPEFLASLDVGYRWYLQCSTMTDVDTVAFAVPEH